MSHRAEDFIAPLEPGHKPWCNANDLTLCFGCRVKYGWNINGVTGEPTTCTKGTPHRWLRRGCTCHRRKGDRRAPRNKEEA